MILVNYIVVITILMIGTVIFLFTLNFCLKKPNKAIIFYILLLYLFTFIGNERVRLYGMGQLFSFIPFQVSYIVDLFFFSLIIVYFLQRIYKRPKSLNSFSVLIFFLFLATIISWFVNSVGLFTALARIRIFIYMLGGYFILKDYKYNQNLFEKIFKVLMIISILQFPIVLFQRFIGVQILGWGQDLVCGTFTRYPKLVLFQLIFFIFGLSALFSKQYPSRNRKKILFVGLLAVASLSLTNSRIIFVFIPLFTGIYIFKNIFNRPISTISKSIILGGLILLSLVSFTSVYGGKIYGTSKLFMPYISNPSIVYRYFFAYQPEDLLPFHKNELTRMGSIIYSYKNLDKFPGGLLLGAGPGSTGKWRYKIANDTRSNDLNINTAGVTQASIMFAEMGFIGVFILFLFFLFGIRLKPKKNQTNEYSMFNSLTMDTFPFILLLFFLMQFYGNSWMEPEAAFLFWFFMIYMLKVKQTNKSNNFSSRRLTV